LIETSVHDVKNTSSRTSTEVDAIRKLAGTAGANSKAIIENVQAVVELVRDGMTLSADTEQGLTVFLDQIDADVAGIDDVSDGIRRLGESSEEMLTAHNGLVRATLGVTDSMVVLHNNSRAIEDSMNTLLETAAENKRAIDEITDSMSDIAGEVNSLNLVSDQNAESVRNLKSELGKFTVVEDCRSPAFCELDVVRKTR
jgi:methyl-accepting chemotaxis protein